MQPFSFQLLSFSLFQDVLNSSLLTVSSLSITPVTLTPCSRTSKEFLTCHLIPNCFPHLSHTPHSLLIPDLHPPLIIIIFPYYYHHHYYYYYCILYSIFSIIIHVRNNKECFNVLIKDYF